MKILLDTNVLCRLADRGHPFHSAADDAVRLLRDSGHALCIVPQVLHEYWVVVTRPTVDNGLGMSPEVVDKAIDLWLELFTLLRDERGIFAAWRDLIRLHKVIGKSAHDARLVAAMQRHNISHLLTFNVADFKRYPGIELIDANTSLSI